MSRKNKDGLLLLLLLLLASHNALHLLADSLPNHSPSAAVKSRQNRRRRFK